MSSGSQTIQGKAFEYACLNAFIQKLQQEGKNIQLSQSKAYNTALNSFNQLNDNEKKIYQLAAETATKIIFPLEPKLLNEDNDIPLLLSISSDGVAKGAEGDVRDIICIRLTSKWEVGFSCKHNHQALKHPRITEAKDFGNAWLGYKCSKSYIDKMEEIIKPIEELQQKNICWRDIPDKIDRFYVPILKEFIKEFRNICNEYPDAPQKLLSYFFGSKDFYKIISLEKDSQTKVVAFNMNGTLNKPSSNQKPIYKVKQIHYPTRLVDIGFKKSNGENSKTTISIIFDGGWQIDMRLHNADSKIKVTGLKYDVQLTGQPNDIYQQQRSWFES